MLLDNFLISVLSVEAGIVDVKIIRACLYKAVRYIIAKKIMKRYISLEVGFLQQ